MTDTWDKSFETWNYTSDFFVIVDCNFVKRYLAGCLNKFTPYMMIVIYGIDRYAFLYVNNVECIGEITLGNIVHSCDIENTQ